MIALAIVMANKNYPAALALAFLFASCAAATSFVVPVGRVAEQPGLADAQALVWREAYGRTDASPLVYLVQGADLDCTDPANGQPGFQCTTVGCRGGCTIRPDAVSISFDGRPWSKTALAHEDQHAKKIRLAVAALLYTPVPAVLELISDRDHEGPEWKPGGEVDQANQLLAGRGL